MNKKLEESLIFGELLRWIGVWVLMSMVDGSDQHSFWAAHNIDIYYGVPFQLTKETWMTTHWPNHVFCFLLALTIVNVQNAGCYFAKLPKIDALQA